MKADPDHTPTGLGGHSPPMSLPTVGVRVVNAALTGKVHPITGIPFVNGFPDFSSVAIRTVQLERVTGYGKIDKAAANAAAGLDEIPAGYMWHHAENGVAGSNSTTMQLIPADVHAATAHTGTAAYARAVGGLLKDMATDPTTYMSVGVGTFLSGMAPSPANAADDVEILQALGLHAGPGASSSGSNTGAGASMGFGSYK